MILCECSYPQRIFWPIILLVCVHQFTQYPLRHMHIALSVVWLCTKRNLFTPPPTSTHVQNHPAPTMTRGGWFEKAIDSIVCPSDTFSIQPSSPPPLPPQAVLPPVLVPTKSSGAASKKRTNRKRPAGWTPTPRAERVYKTCAKCGKRNHVRRLCCNGCYATKSEMGSRSRKTSSAAGASNSSSSN